MADHKEPEPTEIPVDGILDLHTFNPGEVKDLLPDYLAVCRNRAIFEVRVIHGKGTGQLRATVQGLLERLPSVLSFRAAGEEEGGWGATIVQLKEN
jgi:DNA-nicking Smr family endonuclease